MTIRLASIEDHAALAGIFLSVRRSTFVWEDPASFQLDDFASATEGELIHVAETAENGIVGFISLWEPEQFVHHLFIANGHRGKGIGRALIDDLARRQPGPFRLKCVAGNSVALSFYKRSGWAQIGEGETDGRPYLLMELSKTDESTLSSPST